MEHYLASFFMREIKLCTLTARAPVPRTCRQSNDARPAVGSIATLVPSFRR
jgi:hypothetical protein